MGEHEPDDEEKSFRFGCGALFGALVGVVVAFELAASYGVLALIMACAVLLCGYLAMRYGDNFWRWAFAVFVSW